MFHFRSDEKAATASAWTGDRNGLVVRGLGVTLGPRRILHDISLSARVGELTAIIGPNGSGKSTLLKAVTGEHAHDGEALLASVRVSPDNRRRLALMRGVLAQHTSVAFSLTVEEVVRLGMSVRGAQGPDAAMSVAEALEAVDLSGFAGRDYLKLSGGEQQRVQLARVLCQVGAPVGPQGPRWIFLDEPVSSLDIKHQLWVMRFARDFAKRGGGVVAVMHDLNLTAMFADQVVALRQGRVHAAGTPQEVLTRALMSELYDCDVPVGEAPRDGSPFVLPHGARVSPGA